MTPNRALPLTRSNARTSHLIPAVPTPTFITISPDRTFTFTFRTPPVTHLLKHAAGIEKGSQSPPGHKTGSTSAFRGSVPVGRVTLKHVYEIARVKCRDEELAVLGEQRVARAVVGSARSMGLEVVA